MKLDALRFFCISFPIFLIGLPDTYGQPVRWLFDVHPGSGEEILLSFTADLQPAWHIYSQNMKEDGPVPTHITFVKTDGYILLGATDENGEETRYYDSLYDMEIGWYSEKVTFVQRVILTKPIPLIEGSITFMVCNKDMCIPLEEKFIINVNRGMAHN